jgi:thioredoxin-related protein
MKNFILLFFLITLTSNLSSQANLTAVNVPVQLNWHTDLMKANEVSKATNKPIFAFFTGSDWCGWCKRMQSNVFSKPDFIKWANENVVLLELDFPRNKALSPELKAQNNNLKQQFQVAGFPTIWMFNMNKSSDGTKYEIQALGSCGYPQDPEPGKEEVKFLETANAILNNKVVK